MTFWDFLSYIFTLILGFIMFVSWLGVKYDIVGRDERNKQLQLDLIKMQEKERRRKQRKRQKAKGGKS